MKKQEADKRRAERKLRHMQDDLRYALKKLSAPIDPSMSYEEVCSPLLICRMIMLILIYT